MDHYPGAGRDGSLIILWWAYGAAFINAGILTLLCLFIVYNQGWMWTVIQSHLRFDVRFLFGKNLLNI